MTKPSQRRAVRYDQSGCMWGLMSILDFRHGSRSNRKLIADKRRGTRPIFDSGDLDSKPKPSIDVEENLQGKLGDAESFQVAVVDAPTNKPSVKTLIEEEMGDTDLRSDQHVDPKKKRKNRKKQSRGSLDMDVNDLNKGHESFDLSKCPCNHAPEDGSLNKPNHGDLVLEEFHNHIDQRGISEVCLELKPKKNNSILGVKEKLHEAIKEFISREVANEKNLVENGRVNFSKEMVDALQIPNLNEESFLKLLQDPNFLKSCEDDEPEDADKVGKGDNGDNVKQRKFFGRHNKLPNPKKGRDGNDSDTIIILKPGPNALKGYAREGGTHALSDSSRTRQAERARSYVFLAEIKRRWKSVMGKQQNPDMVVKRQSSSSFKGENPEIMKSPSKDHFFIETIAKPRHSKAGNDLEIVDSSMQRLPNIYVEAKRHLLEMLSSGPEEVDSSSGVKSPKTLARILALSEYNSPIPSPGRNYSDKSFATAEMRLLGNSSDRIENKGELLELKIVENEESRVNSLTQCEEARSSNMACRDLEIEEEASSAGREGSASDAVAGNTIKTDAVSENVESTHSSEKEVVRNNQSPSSSFESPPSSSTMKTAEALEMSGDKPERPSPVSVLEPLFMDEEISPARTPSRSVELLIEPLEIKFDEGDNFTSPKTEDDILLLYVNSVLKACGLNWNEIYLKSQASDQLLEPTSYGDVDFFCDHPQYDQCLVFDCINEALLDMIDHYFHFCPLVSFTKPTIRLMPSLKDAVAEVRERVCWHLHVPIHMARTLDQVVRRDMARFEKWMDLRDSAESVGLEMGDYILDDLIKDYVGESMKGFS